MTALGCSDGILSVPGPSTAESPPVPPVIVSFEADPMVINAGGSTTLKWEVTGADKLSIESSGVETGFSYETDTEFTGSTVAADLKETTTFILTATKLPVTLAEQPSAEATEEPSGEEVVAEEKPAEEEVVAPEEEVTAEEESSEEETTATEEEATVEEPGVIRMTVTVTVNPVTNQLKIENFYAEATAGQSSESYILNAGESTVLHWNVVPAEAVVSLTSSTGEQPILGDCESESTDELELEGEVTSAYPTSGCASVAPLESTVYTLSATLGEETVSQELSIEVGEPQQPTEPQEPQQPVASAVQCSEFSVAADNTPVFAGETIDIRWTIPQTALSAVAGVKILNSAQGESVADPSSGGSSVAARAGGYIVSFVTAEGQELCSKAVQVPVATLEKRNSIKMVSIADDPQNASGVYMGEDLGGFNAGKIKVGHYGPDWSEIEVPFFDTLKTFDELTGYLSSRWMEETIQTFPVNAIAVSDAGRMFVASTGGVLYQDGDGWKPLTRMLRTDKKGVYTGSHATCFGKTQNGKQKGVVVSLGQVCDMAVTKAGALIIAADHGVFTLADVEKNLNEGGKWEGKESPLYGSVVNTIEVLGDTIFVGGAKGIFMKSGDADWTAVSEDTGEVYSLSAANRSDGQQVLVAGLADSVMVLNVGVNGNTESRSGLGSKVYHVSVDANNSSVIYAGTEQGLFISRDGGSKFSPVALPVEGGAAVVRAMSVRYSSQEDGAGKADIYLATEQGVFKALVAQ
ncbi:MAG: hypothetical protein Q7S68_05955 [Deltaproteobacteria bacterium]|nr:hypothetical protein [Deltaproteobacteria bacterium]